MSNFIEKFYDIFKSNFVKEKNKNIQFKEDLDFLMKKKEKFNFLEKFLDKNLNKRIEDCSIEFYSTRNKKNEYKIDHYNKIISFLRLPIILKNTLLNFNKLNYIEKYIIPNLFVDLFNFEDIKGKNDGIQSLKKFRREVYDNIENLNNKKVIIKSINDINIDNIEIKNLKKVISASFEIKIDLLGKIENKLKKNTQNFSGYIDFIKENDNWVINNFIYEKNL